MSSQIGASMLAELCLNMENKSAVGAEADYRKLFDSIKDEYEIVVKMIEGKVEKMIDTG